MKAICAHLSEKDHFADVSKMTVDNHIADVRNMVDTDFLSAPAKSIDEGLVS